ncbi:MAG: 4-hydroxy-tetrahydrodipicolinate reductase [Armatimonadetes bacterium]|nr:4-hydroxy-tetrahydrodipicolinate reductase [Armatimonadota bacterium]
MGREVCRTVDAAPDMEFAFAVDRREAGTPVSDLIGAQAPDINVTERLEEALSREPRTRAAVDFTHPSAAAANGIVCLRHGVTPIIGTSGLTPQDLDGLRAEAETQGVPAFYIPNFALGAVLMMKFAKEAAQYMPECEIIELHHDRKADAPSGTAMRTAELIAEGRRRPPKVPKTEVVKLQGARGGTLGETPIHSVRLPGLLAHQQVIFGGPGEVLTVRHDSLSRESFMSGVLLALRNFQGHKGLVVGLENLLG